MRPLLLAIAVATCAPAVASHALEALRPDAAATLADAAWLIGRWQGEGFGGRLEEIWAAPAGRQMIGLFRLVKDDLPVLYELMLIEEFGGGLRYRVKHFNPDFVGWEEKGGFHEFPWVSGDAVELRFEGLTLRRVGEDEADHILSTQGSDGAKREEILRYRRLRE
jgi:hypothetical protein